MSNEQYKYDRYAALDQETRWATEDEIRRAGTFVNLTAETYEAGGLPLMSDGKTAYVDGKDTHTIIFGATGSKKTRLFCMPMVNMFVRAGESFVVTDPKGEIYNRTAGMAKANGYKTVVINLRDIGKGDMWNPLALPLELYRNGNREDGVAMFSDFISMIAAPQFERTNDVFWPQMASSFATANLLLLAECAKEEEVNLASLGALCMQSNESHLKWLSDRMSAETIAGLNFRNVLTGADNTRRSVYVSLYGMVSPFTSQKNLTAMLSGNTMNIADFGREKTAVYLIIPDEKTTLHFLATAFIKQTYEILIREAQKEANNQLPVRVNFVLDEFCNMPKVPDMASMISAARSRNIRYYLIAQSKHQLQGKYGEDADTIKGNCDNWVFLTSKELDLLEEISQLCGSVYTAAGHLRRLISVSELQRLSKERGEALIMHARQYPTISALADIDSYEMFKGYEAPDLSSIELPSTPVFDPKHLIKDAMDHKCNIPFADPDVPFRYFDEPQIPKKPDASSESTEDQLKRFFNN
ncbi:MAG: type IV secretory system conjugative DNA transfer family protein [Ruminococcaceae bacterium]|nr:type IV secretory system conjugative DNA transfer family protein [Oscillospiraceae bacterium]